MKRMILFSVFLVSCTFNKTSDEVKARSVVEKFKELEKKGNLKYLAALDASATEQDKKIQNCYVDDIHFEQVEKEILRSLEDKWGKKVVTFDPSILAANFNGNIFHQGKLTKTQKIGNEIVVESFAIDSKKVNEKDFTQGLETYLSSFKELKGVKVEPLNYWINSRDSLDSLSPTSYKVELLVNIKGLGMLGERREDRAKATVEVNKKNNQWELQSFIFNERISLKKDMPHFSAPDLKALGLAEMKSYERLEAIRRGGYTLAMADFNNDGHVDFLLGAYGKLQLFKGIGEGKFEEVKDSGLESHTLVKSAIWADFDNDGLKDLLIVRFVGMENDAFKDHVSKQSKELQDRIDYDKKPQVNSVVVYKNLGSGKFRKESEIVDNIPTEHAMPAAVADFNNDGLLDIYVGYPGVKDFTTFSNDSAAKVGKKAQGVYLNQGNMKFFNRPMNSNEKYEIFSNENMIYPHSAVAVDYNQDGHVDIVVVDDRGNLSVAYKNLGNANFVMDNKDLGFQNYGIGMGLATADVNNDGKIDMALSNVTFSQNNRMARACLANWKIDLSTDEDLGQRDGLRLFVTDKKQRLKEQASWAGIIETGDGLGGIEFLDYDNDGLQDLYIANGLWSGTNKNFDLSGMFNRALKHGLEEGIYEGPVTTRSFMMEILASYKNKNGDVPSLGGFQENKLFRNLGSGKFMEVGFLEGVDSMADGYVVGTADLNNDGAIDIILRNADPGTKHVNYPPVEIFFGKKSEKGSVAVTLEGTVSNRDAIGTELTGKAKGMPLQVRQVIANNGTIQSEQKYWFSLGNNKQLDELKIRWPSGKIQVIKNLKDGSHHIVEPDDRKVISQR